MNPLAAVACGIGLVYLLYAGVVLALGLPRLRPVVSPATARHLRITTVTLLAVNWAWRIATGR
jgi:hypothetical protein